MTKRRFNLRPFQTRILQNKASRQPQPPALLQGKKVNIRKLLAVIKKKLSKKKRPSTPSKVAEVESTQSSTPQQPTETERRVIRPTKTAAIWPGRQRRRYVVREDDEMEESGGEMSPTELPQRRKQKIVSNTTYPPPTSASAFTEITSGSNFSTPSFTNQSHQVCIACNNTVMRFFT